MRSKYLNTNLFYLPVLTGVVIVFWWLTNDPTKDLQMSMPGMDNRVDSNAVVENVIIGEHFERFSDANTNLKESWPRFRGAELDNISKSSVKLIDKFPSSGPKVLWTKDLGEGHAGAAIYEGLAYLLDYNEESRSDVLHCYDLKTGEERWKRWYDISLKRNHGMSRTIPAITEKYILTVGPKCHVMCMDRVSGELLWGLDIGKKYESEVPFWYTGQCPLIDGEEAILATGGKTLLIGVDLTTGEILWETPNERKWKMSHSSIMPYEFEGVKMYVYSAIGGAAGIAADGPDKGKILWETTKWNHSVVAPSPICLPDGKIFLAAGYGAGSMVLQLSDSNGKMKVEVLEEYATKEGLSSEQQTPVYHDGMLYGILPKDAGPLRNQFVCVNPNNFKEIVWSSGKTARFGLGPYMIADGKFFIMDDNAVLTIVQPSKTKYIQLDQVKLFEGHDAWAPFAIADGFLILRDSKKMLCLDMNI